MLGLLAISACCGAGAGAAPPAEPDPLTAPLAAQKPLYLNPDAPLDQRVADLVGRLTLEEKAAALNHRGPALERIGLRSDQWNQCLNGVKWDRPTTFFPTSIALAATWNVDLLHEVATVLSDEARAIYNGWKRDPAFPGEHKGLIYRAPVINISRNPYWGRIHECYGEDPFLTGRLAVAYVRGLQGDDPRYLKLAATLKHFAVNNVEKDRQRLNAVVPEHVLREYWLPHFHDAVVEGHAQSLMASYNAINGTPNNINHWLLTDLLKGEWRHEGFVVSDLGGVRTMVEGHEARKMTYVDAVAQSLMAGCDFSDKEFMDHIPAAVREGKLTEARLDDAVRRVLRVRLRLGEFDPPERLPWAGLSPATIASPAHRAVALEAARQCIVLLQNGQGLLPLDRAKVKRLAVLGPQADRVTLNNYTGQVKDAVAPLQGLKDRAGAGMEIVYAQGCGVGAAPLRWLRDQAESPVDPAAALRQAADLAAGADAVVVFVGTNAGVEHEGRDRVSLGLPGRQEELVKAVVAANPRTIVVLMSAGPLTVPWLKEHVPALLQAWWPGEEGGHAIADVLFGDANPAGRLPYTVYASEQQVPPQDEYDIAKGFTYMYVRGAPLYAFGHGLSYTTFAWSDLRLAPAEVGPADTLTATLTVRNTGARAGDEVVQLYARDPDPSHRRPQRQLVGFQRIALRPGESKVVTIPVSIARLAHWDETAHGWAVWPGAYELHAGPASDRLPLKAAFHVR